MADEPAEFWGELGIDPVEIALPGGVGYTLRAYRAPSVVTPTDVSERAEEEDPFAAKTRGAHSFDDDEDELPPIDEAELAAQALAAEAADEDYVRHAKSDDTALDLEPIKDVAEAADDDDEDEDDAAELDEVPVFLSHKGRLLLFKSAAGLVSFVKSKAPHDLAQLPEWKNLAKTITAARVEADDDDSYELDLVVENLRGGHDAWDSDLILSAGEIARDLGYALQLDSILSMLSPGAPLDELDEALRGAANGGIGGFMAKRRVKKIGAQQASLGWRTVIGKISSNVDWRD
ncbi:hypothetical protein F4553_003788 [Allocatelliglobosispora scoriae]|uniref:Uncharacterized protein n=1 Tax=Allocatelliglobosispora scoriae TaxID=643052 RepID=A0A841BTC3_9ACTN|nr:DNA primase [Allocatelliglobosispora scoriae]MBB5870409.1 hypothetical protein [Allocatelliglobosispora scoriae]